MYKTPPMFTSGTVLLHDNLSPPGQSRLFSEPKEVFCAYDAETARKALTRIADVPDPVGDELWAECQEHFDETQLSGLILSISAINVWNRTNVATRQLAGQSW